MENNKSIVLIKFKDIKSNNDLGEYFPSGNTNSSLLNELNALISHVILKDQTKYFPKGEEACNTLKNHNISWKYSMKSNTLNLIVYSNILDKSNIDNILEEIDSQNIVKYLDKQGKINNVAKQNLQYIIDKNIDSKINTLSNTNRLDSINYDLEGIKKDMKTNIQNLVSNVENSKVMDERASKIKDSSFMFQKSSSELHRMSKMRRYRNILILTGVILIALLIIYFIIF